MDAIFTLNHMVSTDVIPYFTTINAHTFVYITMVNIIYVI